MFKKVLIANRGEIACRIIKTLRKMGIQSVAIYSSADRFSPHVKMADEAYYVGEATPLQSYLNIEHILSAAKQAKVCAIHPGYGFLSENAEFAERVRNEGITFIGPSSQAMLDVGSKQRAKEMLAHTKVPLIPGFNPPNPSDDELFAAAESIGWPIVLKAAHGGGGKGLKIVSKPSEFKHAIASARREAKSYFNNDELLLEKLIEHPRHLEVQIIADQHGNAIHLFERDCSVQRRQQKIVEEAPAINLPQSVREELYSHAITVVRTFNYTNAGTVEFLLADNNTLYFMEMNARLQVEHPITELITGLDLVEWQVRIAGGEPLTIKQPTHPNGHAIECRICAEIPEQDFKPSQGQITHLAWPAQTKDIRIDTGIENQQQITSYYDSLLAKAICWQPTRNQAIHLMQDMLNDIQILGLETNKEYLATILAEPVWQKGAVPIDYLARYEPKAPSLSDELPLAFAAVADSIAYWQQQKMPTALSNFAISGPRLCPRHYEYQDTNLKFSVIYKQPGCVEVYKDNKSQVLSYQYQAPIVFISIEENLQHFTLEFKKDSFIVHTQQQRLNFKAMTHALSRQTTKQGGITSPMPATIVAVFKNDGDNISQGEPLMVLEAMKMEHTIYAPFNGTIKQFFYQLGQQVQEGQELLELTEHSESPS